MADSPVLFDPPFLTSLLLKFWSSFIKFSLGLWPLHLLSLPWGQKIPSLENFGFLHLQKVQNCYFNTYSWPLYIIFIKQYLGFYYWKSSPIRTILEFLQILAISALYSKAVKKMRPPNFFFISPFDHLLLSPRFHHIPHLRFS